MEHCWGVLDAARYEVRCALSGDDLDVQGTLWGGNLALLAHLVGTPYLPRVDAGILFVEDVGEHPYRIERMLYQLHHAGILDRQRALLFGEFNEYSLGANDNGYDFDAMIEHVRASFGIPVFTGLPFGHRRDKLTLPHGAHCELAVRDRMATLAFSRYAMTP
jgi:muramoyltetrapeptide carboxypeptidase